MKADSLGSLVFSARQSRFCRRFDGLFSVRVYYVEYLCIMSNQFRRLFLAAFCLFLATYTVFGSVAEAAKTPAIKISSVNQVPLCITPENLMMFVAKRNKRLSSKFNGISRYYQQHGERLGIRWDYAFFQMIVETNWLRYHAPSGRKGDVSTNQNNFAGLGATGGGVAGEKFKNVSTGVLAHLQHIQMYSGTRVYNPVAERTRKVQEWLLPWSQKFKRPVTFTDLTKKWSPTDRGYSNDIEGVAKSYRKSYCKNNTVVAQYNNTRTQSNRTVRATTSKVGDQQMDTVDNRGKSGSKKKRSDKTVAATQTSVLDKCEVFTASYGGNKAILIRSVDDGITNYHALGVHAEVEKDEAFAFIRKWAKGGRKIGSFKNQEEALIKAFQLCRTS